jgi:hypothetical protein
MEGCFMNDFKKRILVVVVIAVLAVIGSVMNSQQSTVRAQGGPTVTIDPTQLPLPVKGSLGVSGTIAATQSGPWNVGITGTPNVQVVNPATAPQFFINLNDPGRIAYQRSVLSVAFPITFGPVPANHRLVVEHIAGELTFTATPLINSIQIQSGLGSNLLSEFSTPILGNAAFSFFDQPVHFYVDQNQTFNVTPSTCCSVSANEVMFTVTGYLLDCSVASCAPIANF